MIQCIIPSLGSSEKLSDFQTQIKRTPLLNAQILLEVPPRSISNHGSSVFCRLEDFLFYSSFEVSAFTVDSETDMERLHGVCLHYKF